jgi:hypothetical protein
MTGTVEYPVSHKYVVTKTSKIFVAMSDKLGWSFSQATRTEQVYLRTSNMSFKESSQDMPMR